MNSGMSPLLLPKNQCAFLSNVSLRGGFAKSRPPFVKKVLKFDTSMSAGVFANGLFQGCGYLAPDNGPELLCAAISGRLYNLSENLTDGSWTVTDVSISNDLNTPTATHTWMRQAERWLIINEGTTKLPIFYDGIIARRAVGPSVLIATTTEAFVPPVIGGTVVGGITVSPPYSGPFNIPVLLHGEYYTLNGPSNQSGYSVTLLCVTDNNLTQPAGAVVEVDPSRIAITTNDISPFPSAFVSSSTEADYGFTSGHVLSGSGGFVAGPVIPTPLSGYVKTTVNYTIQPVVSPQYSFSQTPSPMQIKIGSDLSIRLTADWKTPGNAPTTIFNIPAGTAIKGTGPITTLGTLLQGFSVPAPGTSVTVAFTSPYTGPINQIVWIGTGQYVVTSAVVIGPQSNLSFTNLTDPTNQPQQVGGVAGSNSVLAGAQINSIGELPAGRMCAYGMGRVWMSISNGRQYMAGDAVGDPSGSSTYNFRDSVLKTSENDFLAGGGLFSISGIGDLITALVFPPMLDASLGDAPLEVCTPLAIYANNSPADRTTWETLTFPIQSVSLKDKGPLSDESTVLVNSDTFFRCEDGIASLVLARRDFNDWGNRVISNEINSTLAGDNRNLLGFASAASFDNRFLCTFNPQQQANGVSHSGLVALNFDLISSLRGKLPPSWENQWIGLTPLQVITGRVNGSLRMFIFNRNAANNSIELYELLAEGSTTFDDTSGPVTWEFQTGALFNTDIKPGDQLAQLRDGEMWFNGINENCTVKVYYRPDFYPEWTLWNTLNLKLKSNVPGYFTRLGLGEPSSQPTEQDNNRPLRNGYFFQIRVVVTGSCTFQAMRLAADSVPESTFARVAS